MKVFISYAREDLETAKKLRDDLETAGIRTWLDKENLLPGQNWREVILREIRESRYFIALLSSRALSREGFVHKELKTALDFLDHFPADKTFLIPVRIDDCEPVDEKLRYIHWADLFPSYQEGLNHILRVLLPEIKQPSNETKPVPKVEVVSPKIEPLPQPPVKKPTYQLRKKPMTVSNQESRNKFRFTDNGDGTITDHTTGLMWQKSASDTHVDFEKAGEYIKDLNQKKFAGYNDWRLPMVDELKSLRISEELHIDPIFDNEKQLCWIAAQYTPDRTIYSILFSGHSISWGSYPNYGHPCVRAVRRHTMIMNQD